MSSDFFVGVNGRKRPMDLDKVVRVLRGWSGIKNGWQAYVVYIPTQCAFVELLSSPPDARGNSKEEAVEVDEPYLAKTFGMASDQLEIVRSRPDEWVFLERRS